VNISKYFKQISDFIDMAWVAGAILLGALAYILSRDDERSRCPYCKAFVRKYAPHCQKCSAKLGWE